MTHPKDEARRRIMRGSLLMLPATALGSVLAAPAQAAADSADERGTAVGDQRENILYWGADPTGHSDSSGAFAKAVRSRRVTSIHVPPGVFTIGRTVDLQGKNLIGPGRMRWKHGDQDAMLMARPGLKGAMFVNHGPVVRDLNFNGGDRKGVACLNSYGYNTAIENVAFASAETAIVIDEGAVNYNLVRCTFVGVRTGVHVGVRKPDVSTTVRFIGNEFNYTDNCIIFEGELYGATFQDNIFENAKGDAVLARIIYDSSFIGNWWEERNGGKEDWPCVRTTMGQQIMNCFASANRFVAGWRDMFTADAHSGSMGGVSASGGQVVVRDSTGKALRMGHDTLRAETDDWAPETPFVIQGSYAKAHQRAHPIVLRHTGADGDIEFDSDKEVTGDGVWTGKLRFASRVGAHHKLQWDEYQINRERAGIVGQAPVTMKNGQVRPALTGVAQFARWRKGDDHAPGIDFFAENRIEREGRVRLCAPQGQFEFHDPLVSVTTDDDTLLAGIDYLSPYSGAYSTYKACHGFVFSFVDRQTGRPRTPQSFTLQIFHPS